MGWKTVKLPEGLMPELCERNRQIQGALITQDLTQLMQSGNSVQLIVVICNRRRTALHL